MKPTDEELRERARSIATEIGAHLKAPLSKVFVHEEEFRVTFEDLLAITVTAVLRSVRDEAAREEREANATLLTDATRELPGKVQP